MFAYRCGQSRSTAGNVLLPAAPQPTRFLPRPGSGSQETRPPRIEPPARPDSDACLPSSSSSQANMDVLASYSIFQELQLVHDTGYFSALPSLEENWQQELSEGPSAVTLDGVRITALAFLRLLSEFMAELLHKYRTGKVACGGPVS
ncbi:UNVERIFIED_CONTAM: hypothetical protein K2H54_046965 [Gekko kuhli]